MSQNSQRPAIVKKPKLLDEVRNAIRTKHYSMKTEEALQYDAENIDDIHVHYDYLLNYEKIQNLMQEISN